MKRTLLVASALALIVGFTPASAVAKASFGDPTANVRVDHGWIDVGDRASTYTFSSLDRFYGLTWLGGGKRPVELKDIVKSETRNGHIDTEGELQALLSAARTPGGAFAMLEEGNGKVRFSITNKHGTVDIIELNGLVETPIPGAALLLGSGLLGLGWARRRSTG